jgi:hypothetical protein
VETRNESTDAQGPMFGSTATPRAAYPSYHSIRLPRDPRITLPATDLGRDLPLVFGVNCMLMRLLALWVPPIM